MFVKAALGEGARGSLFFFLTPGWVRFPLYLVQRTGLFGAYFSPFLRA